MVLQTSIDDEMNPYEKLDEECIYRKKGKPVTFGQAVLNERGTSMFVNGRQELLFESKQ